MNLYEIQNLIQTILEKLIFVVLEEVQKLSIYVLLSAGSAMVLAKLSEQMRMSYAPTVFPTMIQFKGACQRMVTGLVTKRLVTNKT